MPLFDIQSKISLVKSEDHYKGVQKCLEFIKIDIKYSLLKITSLIIKIN